MDSLLCFLLVLAELVLNKCSVSTSFVFTQGTIAGHTPLSVHGLDRFFHPPNSPQFLCPTLVTESVSQAHCNWGKQHSFPEVCMGRPVFVLPKPSCLSCGITPMYFQSAFSLSVFEIESTFSYPDANHLITQRQFLVFPLRTIPPQQERRLNLDYIFS